AGRRERRPPRFSRHKGCFRDRRDRSRTRAVPDRGRTGDRRQRG
ncbi:MAG: hypothetical protein AVDCRST_MAG90-768, partial [uncultured Microvirga sp.]